MSDRQQPIRLSDDEMSAVLRAAEPIAIDRRGAFLQAIADELARYAELGPGLIHRIVAQTQRRFFDAPELEETRGRWSKYG